ncbi:sugar-binding domain-containing protein [Candidatus Poribacteria bacterium]
MGNDPGNWHFNFSPYTSINLAGKWDFQVDPDNVGETDGWHLPENDSSEWMKIIAPKPWERQGIQEDNLKSPGDAPYELSDARCGDKPYNGFAWYRKNVRIPPHWRGKQIIFSSGSIKNWGRIFVNGKPIGNGQLNPPEKYSVPSEFVRFGEENLIAIQVYNHDNFGGIIGGVLSLYVDGAEPELRETPGALSYVKEYEYPIPGGSVYYTFLTSAMSPATILAADADALNLWGWSAKGYKAPSVVRFMIEAGLQTEELERLLDLPGDILSENWIHLQSDENDILIVLEHKPDSIVWDEKSLCGEAFTIIYAAGPIRAAILSAPAGVLDDEEACRFWARSLRRYPVSASEYVKATTDPLLQEHTIRYNYLDLDSFDENEPLTTAPVPILFSYGLKYKHPGLQVEGVKATTFESEHAPYLVSEGSDMVKYHAPAVDRSKVMKGVGELFGKGKAEHNVRGGVSEDEMFRRMGEWGFDHCRYA